MKLNVSGKLYEVVAYHVRREDYSCDMDEVERLAHEHQPKVIVAGWSAYPRQLDFAAFREIADSVGAKLMVDMAHFAGLVAAGEHPNPVEHADVVTTTIHKTLCGPRSGMILCREELAKDIDRSVFPGQQGGPLMHIIAAKAVALGIAATEPFRARQRQTIANAKAFAEELIANGVEVLTGGTDVHLVLVDLTPTGLDGKTAEQRLEEVGITVNRNAIPFDERPPMNPSGLRIGTPALTTRGLGRGRHARDRAGDRGRALGPLRGRARGAGRADPLPDGAVSALSPALGPRPPSELLHDAGPDAGVRERRRAAARCCSGARTCTCPALTGENDQEPAADRARDAADVARRPGPCSGSAGRRSLNVMIAGLLGAASARTGAPARPRCCRRR